MNRLCPPTLEMLESNHQYVQINKVEPLMDEKRHRLSGKPVTAEAVLRYVFNVTSYKYHKYRILLIIYCIIIIIGNFVYYVF